MQLATRGRWSFIAPTKITEKTKPVSNETGKVEEPVEVFSIAQVNEAASDGRAWQIDLRFVGANPKNKSGRSEKFWTLLGYGPDEEVVCTFGRIGTNGRTVYYDFNKAMKKLYEKFNKGYLPAAN